MNPHCLRPAGHAKKWTAKANDSNFWAKALVPSSDGPLYSTRFFSFTIWQPRSRIVFRLVVAVSLLAIAACLVAITWKFVVVPSATESHAQREKLIRAARNKIVVIQSACQMFQASTNLLPQTLRDLKDQPQGMDKTSWGGPYFASHVEFSDPWGIEFRYRVDQTRLTFTISSAGPDREFDTADDISTKD